MSCQFGFRYRKLLLSKDKTMFGNKDKKLKTVLICD